MNRGNRRDLNQLIRDIWERELRKKHYIPNRYLYDSDQRV
jgi:hypothetical protein